MGLEGGGGDLLVEGLLGIVFSDFEFVAHDGHFGAAVLFAEPEVAHAVGFDGDVALEVLVADFGVVIGAVEVGRGVVVAADAFEELVAAGALGAVKGVGAFEHQVLEEVGSAGGAGDLVAGADAVGDHKGDNGCGVLGQEQNGEPVGSESVFGDGADGFDEGEAVGFDRCGG